MNFSKIFRKKKLEKDLLKTELRRCLSLVNLVLFGIGHMVGAGIFVVTGTLMRNTTGPGAMISFLIAGFLSLLSSLSYAELGSKVPRAGCSYTYSYITFGELPGFVIGWILLCEYAMGVASVGKSFSLSFDMFFDRAISNWTSENIGTIDIAYLGTYPDIVAAVIVVVWTVLIGIGVKVSTTFNNILTVINTANLIFIIIIGFKYIDVKNWSNQTNGGFLPYGVSGILIGTAICFFAFGGFEGLATAGEEAVNPTRNIPLALGISVLIVMLLYVSVATILSLIIPYNLLDMYTPFSSALNYNGNTWAAYIVSLGTLIGLSCSLMGFAFSLTRFSYSMASDGLLFKKFSYIHPKTQTPVIGVIFWGVVSVILALFADVSVMVDVLSLGILACHTSVSANVLILRYQPVHLCQFQLKPDSSVSDSDDKSEYSNGDNPTKRNRQNHKDIGRLRKAFRNFKIYNWMPEESIGTISITLIVICCSVFWFIVDQTSDLLLFKSWWVILLMILSIIGFLFSFSILLVHVHNTSFLTFQVPCIPFIPVISMVSNIGLMFKINLMSWIGLFVLILPGVLVYIFYGYKHSHENESLLSNNKPTTRYTQEENNNNNNNNNNSNNTNDNKNNSNNNNNSNGNIKATPVTITTTTKTTTTTSTTATATTESITEKTEDKD